MENNDIVYRLYGEEMEDLMKYIVKNEIKYDHCKDIIESTDTHDFKNCSCSIWFSLMVDMII